MSKESEKPQGDNYVKPNFPRPSTIQWFRFQEECMLLVSFPIGELLLHFKMGTEPSIKKRVMKRVKERETKVRNIEILRGIRKKVWMRGWIFLSSLIGKDCSIMMKKNWRWIPIFYMLWGKLWKPLPKKKLVNVKIYFILGEKSKKTCVIWLLIVGVEIIWWV